MTSRPCPTLLLAQGLLKLLPLHWIAQAPRLPASLRAELPQGGLQGQSPLPWWAAGAYGGRLRRELLGLRGAPSGARIGAIVPELVSGLRAVGWSESPLLVPIPSWKRRANPLPGLLERALAWQLGWQTAHLLERSRPVLGQHHLNRELRWANQDGAFRCRLPAPRLRAGAGAGAGAMAGAGRTLILIDDILTTGATACAAAAALEQQGWQVAGMACLARTPPQGRDLRSPGRSGDGPG